MFTRSFWIGTVDRAVKSAAHALILLWGADTVFNVLTVDPLTALGVAGGAATLSVLTSLVSAQVGDDGTTSLISGGR